MANVKIVERLEEVINKHKGIVEMQEKIYLSNKPVPFRHRVVHLQPAQIAFLFGIFILVLGGWNWGVTAIRMTIRMNDEEIPDMLTWMTYWGQVAVYFFVFIWATVIFILVMIQYFSPQPMPILG